MMYRIATVTALLLSASVAQAQSEGENAPKRDFDLTLQEAYKKELAFLVGQQRQLEKRLGNITGRNVKDASSLESSIAALENRLIAIDGRLQDSRESLQEVERSAESSTEDQQLIRATLEQASASLADYDLSIEVPEEDTELSAAAVEVFGKAGEKLGELSSVRRQQNQEFFLQDGRKVEGTVVHLGRIAAFGSSEAGGGALAPAGAGKLKVWKDPAQNIASALAQNQSPSTLKLFLYESIDAAVEDDAEQTAVEHVAAGGAIAWVIVCLGLLGVLLAIARGAILYTCSGSTEVVEEKLGATARGGTPDEVIAEAKGLKGSAARVTASVFKSIRDGSERLDEAISEGLIAEGRRIQLFGTAILVIAAVSPLLGLLGTVTGMISTFDVITKFGTGDPKMLSGGISTALITTELGLIVAIPTLLLGNLLKGWADRIEAEAERAAIRMVALHTGNPVPPRVPPSEAPTDLGTVPPIPQPSE